jgi:DNA-binding NarL/FixJ family response regulator
MEHGSKEQPNAMRILIVDDNESIRRAVKAILISERGLEVCGEARNGLEATERARQLQPDLVLLDISMPGMNGLEVSRLIRKESVAVKILIMSQNDAAQFLPAATEAGADGCIDKSRMTNDLLREIKKIQGERSV